MRQHTPTGRSAHASTMKAEIISGERSPERMYALRALEDLDLEFEHPPRDIRRTSSARSSLDKPAPASQ